MKAQRVVFLAEPRGGVSILLDNFADGRIVYANDGVIAGITRCLLRDHAITDGMMVPASDQRGAGRRAKRGRVELRITEPHACNSIKYWGRDNSAEGA